MSLNADELLTRVTVVAPTRRVDLALPASMTLRELMPRVLELAGVPAPSATGPAPGWVLQRVGEDPLDPGVLVGALGVRDGDFLHLLPADAVMPDAAFDDVVDAVALTTSRRPPWTPAHTRISALVVATALLLGVPCTFSLPLLVQVVQHRTPAVTAEWRSVWTGASVLALLVACVAAVAAARRRAPTGFVRTLEVVGLMTASAVAVWSMPADADIAQRIAVSGAAVLLVALVLSAAAPGDREVLLAACMVSVLVGATALVMAACHAPTHQTAAVALVLVQVATALAPGLAVRLAGVPLDLAGGSAAPDTASIVQRAVRADRMHVTLLWSLTATSLLLVLPALTDRSVSMLVLVGVVALVALLRARHQAGLRQRIAVLTMGGGLALCMIVRIAWLHPTATVGSVVVLVSTLMAVAALAMVLAPDWLHRLDLEPALVALEWLAIAALVPALLWLLGAFSALARL